MPNLVAYFEFEVLNPEEFDASERAGEGTMQIWAEREPETVEEFAEVSRQIGLAGKFGKVRILSLFHDDNNAFQNLKTKSLTSADIKLDAVGDTDMVEDLIKTYLENNPGDVID